MIKVMNSYSRALSRIASSRFSPNHTMCGLNNPKHPFLLHFGNSSMGIFEDIAFGSGELKIGLQNKNIEIMLSEIFKISS